MVMRKVFEPWTVGQGIAMGLLTTSVFWAIVRELLALHLHG